MIDIPSDVNESPIRREQFPQHVRVFFQDVFDEGFGINNEIVRHVPRTEILRHLARKPATHFLKVVRSLFESKRTILEDFRGTGIVEVLAEESEQPWATVALLQNIAKDGLDLFGRFQLPLVRGIEELTHPVVVQPPD